MTDKYLYVVRHGQSEGNLNDIPGDTPLTETGRSEASLLGERFSKLPIEIVISSTLKRARETAEIIAERIQKPLQYTELAVEKEPPSRHPGKDEYFEVFKKFYDRDEADFRDSDEETFSEVQKRGQELIHMLEEVPHEHVVLVTHGLFIRVLFGILFFGKEFNPRRLLSLIMFFTSVQNTGITVFRFRVSDKYTKTPRWRLITWNDHAHLG